MKAYVATAYTDGSGTHLIGEEIDVPHDTPEQKFAFENMVSWGIISSTPPRAPTEDAPKQKQG